MLSQEMNLAVSRRDPGLLSLYFLLRGGRCSVINPAIICELAGNYGGPFLYLFLANSGNLVETGYHFLFKLDLPDTLTTAAMGLGLV